jgi:hypothetical protein
MRLVPPRRVPAWPFPPRGCLEKPERTLFGEETPLLERSIERLLSLLSEATASSDRLLEAIPELGPRTAGHLRQLTKLLADSGAEARMSWRSPRGAVQAHLSPDASRAFHELLGAFEETERTIVVTGRLVGGSLVRRRSELELPDETIVSGNVSSDIVESIAVTSVRRALPLSTSVRSRHAGRHSRGVHAGWSS